MLDEIEKKLNKKIISSSQLTSNFKFIDNKSKKTIKYNDDFYIPFFYYLGQMIEPKKVFELGVNLAFLSSAFFKSCKKTNYFLGFQQITKDYFNTNIARSNLCLNYKNKYDIYCGNLKDENFLNLFENQFDLIIINHNYPYDILFEITEEIYLNKLSKNGIIVFSDLIKNNSFDIFQNMSKGYKLSYKVIKEKIGVLIK